MKIYSVYEGSDRAIGIIFLSLCFVLFSVYRNFHNRNDFKIIAMHPWIFPSRLNIYDSLIVFHGLEAELYLTNFHGLGYLLHHSGW